MRVDVCGCPRYSNQGNSNLTIGWRFMNSQIEYDFSNRSNGHLTTSLAHNGIREATENRRVFFTELHIPHCTSALIEHAGRCQLVTDQAIHFVEKSDALITTNDDIALAVDFADCHPVLLQSVVAKNPSQTIRAIVHCSRQSLICGVLKNTLVQMRILGSTHQDTLAIIGPGLCVKCHEIEKDFHDRNVLRQVPFSWENNNQTHITINMVDTICNTLIEHQISQTNICCTNLCTKCTEMYYSYRGGDSKDGVIRNNLAVIMPPT